jgi:hypothetical protein
LPQFYKPPDGFWPAGQIFLLTTPVIYPLKGGQGQTEVTAADQRLEETDDPVSYGYAGGSGFDLGGLSGIYVRPGRHRWCNQEV